MNHKQKVQILFVCSGNLCRSVMAEAFLQAYLPDNLKKYVNVTSAGTMGQEGVAPPQEVIEVMHEQNIDVNSHRSQSITRELVADSQFVFAMAEDHYYFLRTLFPHYESQIFLLGNYLKNNRIRTSESIPDPYGEDIKFFRYACHKIEKEIQRILPDLFYTIEKYLE